MFHGTTFEEIIKKISEYIFNKKIFDIGLVKD